jgi:hypothetical protein
MSERKPLPSHPAQPPSTSEPPILEPGVDPGAHTRQVHRRHVAGFLAGLSMTMPLAASFAWLSAGRRAAARAARQEPAAEPVLASPAPPVPAASPAAAIFRPRLLIILSGDAEHDYNLGHAFGEYLNHGSDAALAPLAAVDLACIAAAEIDLPATAMGQGPLALLLVAGDTQRLVRFALPSMEQYYLGNELVTERMIDERIEIVSSAVRRAVLDRDHVVGVSPRLLAHPRVQEIAARARAGYAIADWRTDTGGFWIVEEEADQTKTPREPRARPLTPDEAAHFAPALLALAVPLKGEPATSLLATLAAVARRRVVQGEVPGAEWATSGGCGTTFEDRETSVAIGCGMGHVPARSRRFLHFYTLKPSDW